MLVPFPVLPHQVLREARAILMGILVPCHLAHRRNPEFKRPVQDRYLLDCVAERVVSLFLQLFRRSALRGNVANIQRTTYHPRPRAVLPIILCLRPQITSTGATTTSDDTEMTRTTVTAGTSTTGTGGGGAETTTEDVGDFVDRLRFGDLDMGRLRV
ncbi:hypothetical protein M404DRAFT_192814 [Pisolithus tinctorius Marx 270]|uniref:Uncharacterized protein n=1 Tax=Pisolithus tinctorius Marx 270 TaxID=870435 RepID=A0A0C3PKY6_PISTI|nr:hypothetical protein M404DRAFT_192814 [Pisolithus tinctorius Marx 270]